MVPAFRGAAGAQRGVVEGESEAGSLPIDGRGHLGGGRPAEGEQLPAEVQHPRGDSGLLHHSGHPVQGVALEEAALLDGGARVGEAGDAAHTIQREPPGS